MEDTRLQHNPKQTVTTPALFERIASGDEEAFASFYRSMVPQLRPFIISITRSEIQVEEVIQESFIRFWLHRDQLPTIDNPAGWLFKTTANICYTLFQRSLTEKKALNAIGQQSGATHIEATELIHLNLLKAALQEGIARLSPQRKKVYLLSREQGMTAEEIAAALDLSTQTVRNTLSASLESLRSHLSLKGFTLSLLPLFFLFR